MIWHKLVYNYYVWCQQNQCRLDFESDFKLGTIFGTRLRVEKKLLQYRLCFRKDTFCTCAIQNMKVAIIKFNKNGYILSFGFSIFLVFTRSTLMTFFFFFFDQTLPLFQLKLLCTPNFKDSALRFLCQHVFLVQHT